ncbi:hypothetical protein HK405_010796 [Cladochytrium tenue]|nr:hypothetical protein HK405_010796 [Cladochytrium tenue]
MPSKEVLFALDESVHSIAALNWALEYTVKSPSDSLAVVVVVSNESERDPTISRVKTLLRALHESSQFEVKLSIRVLVGSQVGPLICGLVEDLKPSMLVLGSAGKSHMEGLIVGSVSQYCVSHATCPVIVARLTQNEERGRSINNPSPSSGRAISPFVYQ